MKTSIATMLLIASATCLFAGPDAFKESILQPAPNPVATTSPFAGKFEVDAFALGDWTWSPAKQDQYIGADHAFGGALAAKYFPFSLGGVQIGAAIDQSALDARYKPNPNGRRLIGTTQGGLAARYPLGNFAIYANLNAGVAYGGGYSNGLKFTTPIKKFNFLNDTKFAWSPAVGVEYAITKNIRVLAEGDWLDLGPKKNSVAVRTGIGFGF